MSGKPQAAIDWWIGRPWADYVAVATGGVAGLILDPRHVPLVIDHGAFYQTLAALSATLLTLSTLIVTLLFTVTPTDRLARVLDAVGPSLQHLVARSLTGLVLTTCGFATLFVVEGAVPGRPLQAYMLSIVALMLTRFSRLWWLLGRVLEILMVQDALSPSPPSRWERPKVTASSYAVPKRRSIED